MLKIPHSGLIFGPGDTIDPLFFLEALRLEHIFVFSLEFDMKASFTTSSDNKWTCRVFGLNLACVRDGDVIMRRSDLADVFSS